MAVYEYKCPEHGVFELTRKMTEVKSIESCPECDSEAQMVFSSRPVIYKTDGFYTTDSKK